MTVSSCTLGVTAATFSEGPLLNKAITSLTAFTTALGGEKFISGSSIETKNTCLKIATYILINAALFFTSMYAASLILPVKAFTLMGALGTAAVSVLFKECISKLFPSKKSEKEIELPEDPMSAVRTSQFKADGMEAFHIDASGSFVPLPLLPLEKSGLGYTIQLNNETILLGQEEMDSSEDPKSGDLLWTEDAISYGVIPGNQVTFIEEGLRESFQSAFRNPETFITRRKGINYHTAETGKRIPLLPHSLKKTNKGYAIEIDGETLFLTQEANDMYSMPLFGDLLWTEDGLSFGVLQDSRVLFVPEFQHDEFQKSVFETLMTCMSIEVPSETLLLQQDYAGYFLETSPGNSEALTPCLISSSSPYKTGDPLFNSATQGVYLRGEVTEQIYLVKGSSHITPISKYTLERLANNF